MECESKIGEDVVVNVHEKDDWGNEVDVAWLRKLMVSYPKAHKMSESEFSRPLWEKLEAAMPKAELVKIYWPVGLVLATKR